jgi:hypothetical protein
MSHLHRLFLFGAGRLFAGDGANRRRSLLDLVIPGDAEVPAGRAETRQGRFVDQTDSKAASVNRTQ